MGLLSGKVGKRLEGEMRPIISWLAALLFSLVVCAAFVAGCDAGDDDDDDDGGGGFGEDIADIYDATMTVDADTCNTDNEGAEEDWYVQILQTDDFSFAWVQYKEKGEGADWIDLFQGDVFGTVILKAGVDASPISGTDCTKITVQDYNVKVDPETRLLSGRLSSDIFYMGSGCDSSNIECHIVKTLTAIE